MLGDVRADVRADMSAHLPQERGRMANRWVDCLWLRIGDSGGIWECEWCGMTGATGAVIHAACRRRLAHVHAPAPKTPPGAVALDVQWRAGFCVSAPRRATHGRRRRSGRSVGGSEREAWLAQVGARWGRVSWG